MTDLLKLILGVLASIFRSRATLEAKNLVLRQQVNCFAGDSEPTAPQQYGSFLFVWLYRWFPSVLDAVAIVRPETIIRWRRAGFRAYWRWHYPDKQQIRRHRNLPAMRGGRLGSFDRLNRCAHPGRGFGQPEALIY